ncbi:mucin-5AC-like [Sceloporus undulatus]|uniref:mucin-5AC-like n=1 Tax=Sceloporus undulatus TaxID=8520 RepID=UPI001C4D1333|nr:mucin-5AC-like [Sceloporus undulatus]
MSPAPFKKCDICRVKIPDQDPHSSSFLSLREADNTKACTLCKSLTPQARKNRDSACWPPSTRRPLHSASAPAALESILAAAGPVAQSSTTEPSATITAPGKGDGTEGARKMSSRSKFSKKDKTKSKDSNSTKDSDYGKDKSSLVDPSLKSSLKKRHQPSDAGDGSPLGSPKKVLDLEDSSAQGSSHKKAHSKTHYSSSHKKSRTKTPDGSRPSLKHLKTPLVPIQTESVLLGHDSSRAHSMPASVLASSLPAMVAFHQPSDDEDVSTSRSPHCRSTSWSPPHHSPTPVPRVQVHEADVHHHEDSDYFYNSETDRYFLAVSREVVHSQLGPRTTVPPMPRPTLPSTAKSTSSTVLPMHSTVSPTHATTPPPTRKATPPPTVPAPALVSRPLPSVAAATQTHHSSTQAILDTDSRSDVEGSHVSQVDLCSTDEVAPQSPQELFHPGTSLSTDDVRSFSEHVIKMANTLDLQLSHIEDDAANPVEKRIHGKVPTPPFVPLLLSLERIAKHSWDTSASLSVSSRKIESLYRISPSQCSWLLSHLKQNSAIVEGSQQSLTPKMSTSPADREAKKVDGLAKKAYSVLVLGLKVANYNACMGAYIQCFMEKISPIILDVPDDCQQVLSEIRRGCRWALHWGLAYHLCLPLHRLLSEIYGGCLCAQKTCLAPVIRLESGGGPPLRTWPLMMLAFSTRRQMSASISNTE